MQGNQQGSYVVRQAPHDAAGICLSIIVDTLRKVDLNVVSTGTLHCFQSSLLHVIGTLQYSSWWSMTSKGTVLTHLEQGGEQNDGAHQYGTA